MNGVFEAFVVTLHILVVVGNELQKGLDFFAVEPIKAAGELVVLDFQRGDAHTASIAERPK